MGGEGKELQNLRASGVMPCCRALAVPHLGGSTQGTRENPRVGRASYGTGRGRKDPHRTSKKPYLNMPLGLSVKQYHKYEK